MLVFEHSPLVVHGLATQCPAAHARLGPQSFALTHAGMHDPLLPPAGQTHGPPGPHTIGLGGAAPSSVRHSLSVLHGFCGAMQMPHPLIRPPGLQLKNDPPLALAHSDSELQTIAPSGNRRAPSFAPESVTHGGPIGMIAHAPVSH